MKGQVTFRMLAGQNKRPFKVLLTEQHNNQQVLMAIRSRLPEVRWAAQRPLSPVLVDRSKKVKTKEV